MLTVSPERACPGETVSVTCDVSPPASLLRWTIGYQGGTNLVREVRPSLIGMNITVPEDPGYGFIISATGDSSAITLSVLAFRAVTALNGGTVECRSIDISTTTLQIVGK